MTFVCVRVSLCIFFIMEYLYNVSNVVDKFRTSYDYLLPSQNSLKINLFMQVEMHRYDIRKGRIGFLWHCRKCLSNFIDFLCVKRKNQSDWIGNILTMVNACSVNTKFEKFTRLVFLIENQHKFHTYVKWAIVSDFTFLHIFFIQHRTN